MIQVQAEEAVVGGQGELVEPVVDAERDPLVTASAQRARRASSVGDALTAAEDQELEQLSNTIRSGIRGRGRPAEGIDPFGEQRVELVP
jgi:hypothetical protein